MGLRSFLFTKRSYTPIPIVIIILFFSDQTQSFLYTGLLLITLGETIRFNAVRYAGGRTRTTKVGANELCISGPYAHTRNPLYIGNLFIYSGVVLFSGGPYLLQLLFIVIVYFIFQYSMIISLEEDKLLTIFGKEYLDYKMNVPRLFPLLHAWDSKQRSKPFPLAKTFLTEKRTLQNIILIIFIIMIKPIVIYNFFN